MDAIDTRSAVIERFERYIVSAGMSERRFGIEAVGNHKFFKRLREGKGTLGVIEKAERWIASNPADAIKARGDRQPGIGDTTIGEDAA